MISFQRLQKVRGHLSYQHNGLFLHLVSTLINKVHVFLGYFAARALMAHMTILHNKVIKAIVEKGPFYQKIKQLVMRKNLLLLRC